nr:MAG TPA: hypothetical protein [Caudoviricetes sp.]
MPCIDRTFFFVILAIYFNPPIRQPKLTPNLYG